jgi:hypothetical protein
MAALKLFYFEAVAAMPRFPQWPDAKAGVATMKRAYPFDFLENPG